MASGRPTPKLIASRDDVALLLESFKRTTNFQSSEYHIVIVDALRRLADLLFLDPDEYTPYLNRISMPHRWDPEPPLPIGIGPYSGQTCKWCMQPFSGSLYH